MNRIWIYIACLGLCLVGCEAENEIDEGAQAPPDDVVVFQSDVNAQEDVLSNWVPPSECTCLVNADCASKMGNVGACYEGACDPDSCQCVIVLREQGSPCSDGDLCTEDTVCEGNQCGGGTTVICEDDNPCTDEGCDAGSGCWSFPNEALCDDGDLCTVEDRCQNGSCSPGLAPECDDGNSCTTDTCDGESGCVHLAVDGACDDGNICSIEDTCLNGNCVSSAEMDCDDGDPCTDDGCDPVEGCFYAVNEAPCDDGDLCTVGDVCVEKECVAGGDNLCDDGNACTEDSCLPDDGCAHELLSCDDGSVCTTDYCDVQLGCIYLAESCDDGNVCTQDSCDQESGCQFLPAEGPCDDGEPCTYQDTCEEGECASGVDHECDDGNVCTIDECEWSVGCLHTLSEGSTCDDGNACTNEDSCVGETCVGGSAVMCDDNNPCTSSTCVSAVGCVHVSNENACDDGNICTIGDQCQGGSCAGTSFLNCDDGNACTNDGCIPNWGCFYGIVENIPCDDGLACNGEDTCVAGACQGTICECESDADCSDDGDFCNGVSSCNLTNGSCETSPPIQCSQAGVGPCEASFCQPQTGECVLGLKLNGVSCDDDDLCTVQDICLTGTCIGSTVQCNDDNPCTDDMCDGTTGGCVFETDVISDCDDGDSCTQGESCIAGQCVGGVNICDATCDVVGTLSCGDVLKDVSTLDEMPSANMQEYSCVSSPYPGPEQVYSFVPDASGEVTIYLYDGTVVADVLVLSGPPANQVEPMDGLPGLGEACDPMSCVQFGYDEVQFEAMAGQEYFVVVEMESPGEAAFSLSVSCEDQSATPCEASSSPGCDGCECEACVCAQYPKCCEEEWDEECVDACVGLCGMECEVDEKPCCFGHDSGGCELASCENCVCEEDSFCCNAAWDLSCVEIVEESCDEDCDCDVSVGSCCGIQEGPGCDSVSCQACVCEADPYCCDIQWDLFCVNASYQQCSSFCECAPEMQGDCCEAQGFAGCENHACEQCVCEIDSFCCAVTWDGICVEKAMDGCEADCGCQGDCCVPLGSSMCEQQSCSQCVCDINPACCTNKWSMACAVLAQSACEDNCGCESIAGVDCCVSNGTPGCSDASCEDCVCDEDDFCCEAAWDQVCADSAAQECEDACVCLGLMDI